MKNKNNDLNNDNLKITDFDKMELILNFQKVTNFLDEEYTQKYINFINLEGNHVSDNFTEEFLEFEYKIRKYCSDKLRYDSYKQSQIMMNNQIYYQEISGSGIHKAFVIAAQTGKGKNYAVRKVFRVVSQKNGGEILYLCNRSALSRQQIKEMNEEITGGGNVYVDKNQQTYKIENLTVMTYHHYYKMYRNNQVNDFNKFNMVVADEAHFFCSDAEFNSDTWEILKSIPLVFQNALRIYMTATVENVLDPIYSVECMNTSYFGRIILPQYDESEKTKEIMRNISDFYTYSSYTNFPNKFFYELKKEERSYPVLDVYEFEYDYSMYNKFGYFTNDEALKYFIKQEVNKKTGKWLIFVNNKDLGQKLKKELGKNGIKTIFFSRESRNSQTVDIRHSWERLEEKGELEENQVLVTTSVLDNGFSIKDIDVKHIVLYTSDRTEFLQELGRIRLQDKQNVTIYIKNEFDNLNDKAKEIIRMFGLFYGSENIWECKWWNNDIFVQKNHQKIINELLRKNRSYGYFTLDYINPMILLRENRFYNYFSPNYIDPVISSIESLWKIRINEMARWKAHCMRNEYEDYQLFINDKKQKDNDLSAVYYKMSWLGKNKESWIDNLKNVDDNDEFDSMRSKEFNKLIKPYIDVLMKEPEDKSKYESDTEDNKEKQYIRFSDEIKKYIFDYFEEKKSSISRGKDRRVLGHKSINNNLDYIYNELNKYLPDIKRYLLVKNEDMWILTNVSK